MLHFFKKKSFLLIIIFIASLVFLTNLDGQDFTLDEPYIAILARSIHRYGLPYVWDGVNFLSGSNGLDSTEFFGKRIWTFSPWLEHYAVYLGTLILGDTIFGARFFFAVFGIATVGLMYKILKELFANTLISVLLTFQLIFSLPFFLYVRQARYYSPACFFSTIIVWLLILKLKNKWRNYHIVLFIITSLFLFFTNYVVWIATVFIILTVFVYKSNPLLLIILIEFILAGIGYVLIKPYGGNILFFNQFNVNIIGNIFHYLSYINSYIFPFILIPAMIVLKTRFSKIALFLVVWILIKLIFYSVFLIPHGRYLVDLFPVFILFFGFFYQRLLQYKKGLFIVLTIFVISLTGNILSLSPKSFRFFPYAYYIELTHSYPNIMKQLGSYLISNYKQGDLFWSNEYRLNIYYYSKVPTISPICDTHSNKFIGPDSVTNPNKIRWIIIFQHDDRLVKNLAKNPCFGKIWEEKLSKNYTKTIFPSGNMYFKNDPDIVNREFPPRKAYIDEIIIYERKI